MSSIRSHHATRFATWSPSTRRVLIVFVALILACELVSLIVATASAQRLTDLETIRNTAPPPPSIDPAASGLFLLSPTPTWDSGDVFRVSTGAALADIDGDQRLDFVVSNGNDIRLDPQAVYRNFVGGIEVMPSWSSSDLQYSGHCAVGDLDGDGAPELVVANYGAFDPQQVIAYSNLGSTLETTASWHSADLDNSFSLALGDVDLDADLDLAVANGEAYFTGPAYNDLYMNNAGVLDSTPSWYASELESSYDVAWADVDRDGDLDLASISALAPVRLYENLGGTLDPTAVWSSTIAENGNSLTFGDVDGDGYLDLAVATNRQVGGVGRYHLFMNVGGVLETAPSWSSGGANTYGSAVAFADLDADGDEDLLAGAWWGQLLIYENVDGTLTTGPAWVSQNPPSVIEAIVVGDIDGDGLMPRLDLLPADGQRRLFYVGRRPIHRLAAVRADGVLLGPDEYAVDRDAGWISVAVAPQLELAVDYIVSDDLDVAVTNWDGNIGNFIFDNQRTTTAVSSAASPAPQLLRVFPLPIRTRHALTISGAPAGSVVRLVSVTGRVTTRLRVGSSGTISYLPDRAGVFLIQVENTAIDSHKLIVLP